MAKWSSKLPQNTAAEECVEDELSHNFKETEIRPSSNKWKNKLLELFHHAVQRQNKLGSNTSLRHNLDIFGNLLE